MQCDFALTGWLTLLGPMPSCLTPWSRTTLSSTVNLCNRLLSRIRGGLHKTSSGPTDCGLFYPARGRHEVHSQLLVTPCALLFCLWLLRPEGECDHKVTECTDFLVLLGKVVACSGARQKPQFALVVASLFCRLLIDAPLVHLHRLSGASAGAVYSGCLSRCSSMKS
eukprot:5804443-Amphidinium_carterae.5